MSTMTNDSHKNRSLFCHLITDLHYMDYKRLARFDLCGVMASAFVVTSLVLFVRLMVSR